MAHRFHTQGRTFEITPDFTGEVTGYVNGYLVEEIFYCRDGIAKDGACFGAKGFGAAIDEIEAMIERERQTLIRYPFFLKGPYDRRAITIGQDER